MNHPGTSKKIGDGKSCSIFEAELPLQNNLPANQGLSDSDSKEDSELQIHEDTLECRNENHVNFFSQFLPNSFKDQPETHLVLGSTCKREETEQFLQSDESELNSLLHSTDKFEHQYSSQERLTVKMLTAALLGLLDSDWKSILESQTKVIAAGTKRFISVCLYIMAPKASNLILRLLQEADNWINQIPKILKEAKPKRKDQIIRLIYNSILKMVLRDHLKINKKGLEEKLKELIERKKMVEPAGLLQNLISLTRAPSKKKLRLFFRLFPEICTVFVEVIKNGTFMELFISKRNYKAKETVIEYLSLEKIGAYEPHQIASILIKRFKSFPWPKVEIEDGCNELLLIARSVLLPQESQPEFNRLPNFVNNAQEKGGPPESLNEASLEQPGSSLSKIKAWEKGSEPDFSFIFEIVEAPFLKR